VWADLSGARCGYSHTSLSQKKFKNKNKRNMEMTTFCKVKKDKLFVNKNTLGISSSLHSSLSFPLLSDT
jgi:hypothetical protein